MTDTEDGSPQANEPIEFVDLVSPELQTDAIRMAMLLLPDVREEVWRRRIVCFRRWLIEWDKQLDVDLALWPPPLAESGSNLDPDLPEPRMVGTYY